jgi:hypothetical protein
LVTLNNEARHELALGEEEIFDVTLATLVELTSSYAPAARHLQRINTGARGRKATSGLLVFAAMRNMAAD